MACELSNSSLILPAEVDVENNVFSFITIPGPNRGEYVPLCTDSRELEKYTGYDALTHSWQFLCGWLAEDLEGFVINAFDECCFIGRPYIESFFKDDK